MSGQQQQPQGSAGGSSGIGYNSQQVNQQYEQQQQQQQMQRQQQQQYQPQQQQYSNQSQQAQPQPNTHQMWGSGPGGGGSGGGLGALFGLPSAGGGAIQHPQNSQFNRQGNGGQQHVQPPQEQQFQYQQQQQHQQQQRPFLNQYAQSSQHNAQPPQYQQHFQQQQHLQQQQQQQQQQQRGFGRGTNMISPRSPHGGIDSSSNGNRLGAFRSIESNGPIANDIGNSDSMNRDGSVNSADGLQATASHPRTALGSLFSPPFGQQQGSLAPSASSNGGLGYQQQHIQSQAYRAQQPTSEELLAAEMQSMQMQTQQQQMQQQRLIPGHPMQAMDSPQMRQQQFDLQQQRQFAMQQRQQLQQQQQRIVSQIDGQEQGSQLLRIIQRHQPQEAPRPPEQQQQQQLQQQQQQQQQHRQQQQQHAHGMMSQAQLHQQDHPSNLPFPQPPQQQQQQRPDSSVGVSAESASAEATSGSVGDTTEEETPLSAEEATLALERQQRASELRAARVARFQWEPVGVMVVSPTIAFPQNDIVVRWQIPQQYVSRSSWDRQAAHQAEQRRRSESGNGSNGGGRAEGGRGRGRGGGRGGGSRGGKGRGGGGNTGGYGNNNDEDLSDGDWIGLFRARLRVDNSESHILTRRIQGQATLDRKTGMVTGMIKLRTPRGVGEYDFRYFSGPDAVMGPIQVQLQSVASPRAPPASLKAHVPASPANGKFSPATGKPTYDTPVAVPQLPVGRSNTVRVQVQGCEIFEAVNFLRDSLKASRNRKLAQIATQFATLVSQIESLGMPLDSQYMRPQSNKRNGNRSPAAARVKQETDVLAEIWEITTQILKKYKAADMKLQVAIEKCESELAEAKQVAAEEKAAAEKAAAEEKAAAPGSDDVDAVGDSNGSIVGNGQSDHYKVSGDTFKLLLQSKRDQTALGHAVHSVITELWLSNVLKPLLLTKSGSLLVVDMKKTYCPISERFFQTSQLLREYLLDDLSIRAITSPHEEMNEGHITRVLDSPYPGLGGGPHESTDRDVHMALSQTLCGLANEYIPDAAFYQTRQALVSRVQDIIRKGVTWGGPIRLLVFGSSGNMFGSTGADLDMSLLVGPEGFQEEESYESTKANKDYKELGDVGFGTLNDSKQLSHSKHQGPRDAVHVIEDVAELLRSQSDTYTDVDDARKTARIPILQFTDVASGGIECDICVENRLALRNTAMLRAYGGADRRVLHVAAVLKRWSKARGLNNPAEHTLSSYGYLLMLIGYLQRCGGSSNGSFGGTSGNGSVGESSPLLPVLQLCAPTWNGMNGNGSITAHGPISRVPSVMTKSPDGRVFDTYFFGDDEATSKDTVDKQRKLIRGFAERNTMTAGELLAGFFFEYAFAFDYRRFVVSVRSGTPVSKEVKAAEDSWKLHPRLSIEDPFETAYDVGHVLRDASFKRIRKELARAYGILSGRSTEVPSGATPQEVFAALLKPVGEKEE